MGAGQPVELRKQTEMITMTDARAAKEIVKQRLVGVEGVRGIGITWDAAGEPAVLVHVQRAAARRVKTLLARQPIHVNIVVQETDIATLEEDAS